MTGLMVRAGPAFTETTMALDGAILTKLFGNLFPERSSSRYARFLGIGQRSIQRFLDGEKVWEATPEQVQMFEDQKTAMTSSGYVGKLQAAISDAKAAGVHDEIIAAWLAAAHRSVASRPVE